MWEAKGRAEVTTRGAGSAKKTRMIMCLALPAFRLLHEW